ncbi:hypothetical protein COB57_01135 [Candidatus Peregrinibacteria bacterium]|nr:MAG: hypothetical protein COB57_01135 [Candidatus Peregrinibacteria bacterium]
MEAEMGVSIDVALAQDAMVPVIENISLNEMEPISWLQTMGEEMSEKVVSFLPSLFQASMYIFGGMLVYFVTVWFIRWIASKLPLHDYSEKIGLKKLLHRMQIKSPLHMVLGKAIGGWFFMWFFLRASTVLQLHDISLFLDSVVSFLPRMVVALFIILLGIQFGTTTGKVVEGALAMVHVSSSKIIGIISRFIIILFAVIGSIFQLNIADDFIKILFVGIVFMLSLAGGLAFGLGAKETVSTVMKELLNNKE